MNYDAVAKDILTLAGGPGNVENLTHCFTRLRLELSDRTKADKEKLAQVEGGGLRGGTGRTAAGGDWDKSGICL